MLDFEQVYPKFKLGLQRPNGLDPRLQSQNSLVKFNESYHSINGVFVTQKAIMKETFKKCFSKDELVKNFETQGLWLTSKPENENPLSLNLIHEITYTGVRFEKERLFCLNDFTEEVLNERDFITGIINSNGLFQSVSDFGILLKKSDSKLSFKEVFGDSIKGIVLAKFLGSQVQSGEEIERLTGI